MSGPTNKGIGGDNENEEELNLDNEEPKAAVSAGLSSDKLGINAKSTQDLANVANPMNFTGTMDPQSLKNDNDANQHGYASGSDAKAAGKQYNDALSGAGAGRVAGTMFENTAKHKKEAEEHKLHANHALHVAGGMYAALENTLNDLENNLDKTDELLENVALDITLTIYELEEQQNAIQSLLSDQRLELEDLKDGTSLLLQGESPDSEMGKAQIALKEAEIENTESRLRLVGNTLELTQTQLSEAQETQEQARVEIEELRTQLKAAEENGNSDAISGLQSQLTAAESTLGKSTDKIDALQTRTELNNSIINLSQEARAVSQSCGADASVEMGKIHDIKASTALMDKLTVATADGALSKAEIDDLKANFDSAGISDESRQSFIDTYVASGGSVGNGEFDSQGNETFLEGKEASASFMAQLDLAIAEKETALDDTELDIVSKSFDITDKQADIADSQAQVTQSDQIIDNSDEREVQLADATIDQANNRSVAIEVIKDTSGNNEIYRDKGTNGAEDTYYYLNPDGTKNEYEPSDPNDLAEINRFEMLAAGPQMSPANAALPPNNSLTSLFNNPQSSSATPLVGMGLQSSLPTAPQRFANENPNNDATIAMATKDISRDEIKADQKTLEQQQQEMAALKAQENLQKSELDNINKIKEDIASGAISEQEGKEALAKAISEAPALKTSEEMQLALQDVHAKIENNNITREDLDQALGADASPELKQQMEAALERNGVEIQEPDEPNNTNDATAQNTTYALASQIPGIGPLEYSPIPTQTFQPDANNIYAAPSPGSFADSLEFSSTNPSYAIGSEPTYVANTNNGTENVPQAGETFAMAQANQLNSNAPSAQSSASANDIDLIRLQREAELRLAENSMGPASQSGGAGGGAI